jgi:hypothetical protein
MTQLTIYDENPDIDFEGLNVVDADGNIVGTITGAKLRGNAYLCSVACSEAQDEFWERFLKSMKNTDNMAMGVRHGQKEKGSSG